MMTPHTLTHLRQLEAESIHIVREHVIVAINKMYLVNFSEKKTINASNKNDATRI